MSKPFHFEPSDFHSCLTFTMQPKDAADAANAKLSEWLHDAKVVYANTDKLNFLWYENTPKDTDTHKALLISIEPIEACKHIDRLQYTKITNDGPEYLLANCMNCGESFKLERYEVKSRSQVCKHEVSKVSAMVIEGWDKSKNYSFTNISEYQCSCGAKVQPAQFEVVKE